MKSSKSPKGVLRPKKIKRLTSRSKPDLAEQYRDIQWLRGLIEFTEKLQEKKKRD